MSELRKVRAGKADPRVAKWADGVDAVALYISAIALLELELGVLLIERRDQRAKPLTPQPAPPPLALLLAFGGRIRGG